MNNTGNSLIEGLERLGLIASRIRQNQGEIPQIEIDIILQELRNLYMVALQLDQQGHLADSVNKVASQVEAVAAAKKAAEEKRLAEAEMQKPVFAQEPSAKEAAPIMEPTIDKLEGNPNDELFADGPAKPEAPKQKEGSLFDYLSAEKQGTPAVRTLADKLNQHSRNVEEALENSVNARKVDDLRTIININDKFSFMSDLFHNNMKAYSDFILNLNAYTDREEALAYVAEVAQQYQWDSKPSVVESFYRIFDRKF